MRELDGGVLGGFEASSKRWLTLLPLNISLGTGKHQHRPRHSRVQYRRKDATVGG